MNTTPGNRIRRIALPLVLLMGTTTWGPISCGGSCIYMNPYAASSKPGPASARSGRVEATSIGIAPDGSVRIAWAIDTTAGLAQPTLEAHAVTISGNAVGAARPEWSDLGPVAVFQDAATLFVPQPITGIELQIPVVELRGRWVATEQPARVRDGEHAAVAWAGGMLHAAFYETESRDLAYGCWDPQLGWIGTWKVDTDDDVGRHPTIAVSPYGQVHIGYYDATHARTKHAWGGRDEWLTEPLDLGESSGRDADLAVGPDGVVHVCGFDVVRGELLHLTNGGGTWEIEVVAAGGDVGRRASLAVDADGAVHISCADDTHQAVQYGTNAEGAWRWVAVVP